MKTPKKPANPQVEKYVDIKGEKPQIDWKGLGELEENDHAPDAGRVWNDAMHYLVELGVLSFEQRGNYIVMGAGVLLNPRAWPCELYFTDKEYAEQYKEQCYGNAQYDVGISRQE